MEHDAPRGTWIGYRSGPGGMDHLQPDARARVERQAAERDERRGALLCEVHVRVYARDADDDIFVAFPDGAVLGPESDEAQIAAAVARARDQLGRWR